MEIPRLVVKSELQLPAYTTATATWDLSLVAQRLRIWHCYCCGEGSIPGLGTSSKKKKKRSTMTIFSEGLRERKDKETGRRRHVQRAVSAEWAKGAEVPTCLQVPAAPKQLQLPPLFLFVP